MTSQGSSSLVLPRIELKASFSTEVLDLDNISAPVIITLSATLRDSSNPVRIFPRDTIFDTKTVVLKSWVELFEVNEDGELFEGSQTLPGNKTEVFYGDPDARFTRHVDISETLVLSPEVPHDVLFTLGPIPLQNRPSIYNFVRLPSDWQRGKRYSMRVNPESRISWWQTVVETPEDGMIDVPELPKDMQLTLDIENRPVIRVE